LQRVVKHSAAKTFCENTERKQTSTCNHAFRPGCDGFLDQL